MIKTHAFRLFKAFGHSFSGLTYAFKTESSFRLETAAFALTFPVLFLLEAPLWCKLMIVLCSSLILICELANSAIEATIDRISEKHHPLSKAAKDLGSAMVFVSFIPAVCFWVYAFMEHFGMIYRVY